MFRGTARSPKLQPTVEWFPQFNIQEALDPIQQQIRYGFYRPHPARILAVPCVSWQIGSLKAPSRPPRLTSAPMLDSCSIGR